VTTDRGAAVELITERLRLRRPVVADLPRMHAILSDPRATAFWATLPHQALEESEAFLNGMIEGAPPVAEEFVVEHQGELIGKVGLWRFPEIGFIFDPAYWGRGLAFEAVRPVLDRAFGVHGLPAVDADVDPRNAAALRLLGRLGFEEVGRAERTVRIGDAWCDSVYLRLHAGGWRAAGRG
jgi:RimJ/RimL family protein N-acetyltransferase